MKNHGLPKDRRRLTSKDRGLPRNRVLTDTPYGPIDRTVDGVVLMPVDGISFQLIESATQPPPPAWKRLLRPPPPRRGEWDVIFIVWTGGRIGIGPVRLPLGRRPWVGPPADSWQVVVRAASNQPTGADASQQVAGPDAAWVELGIDAANVTRIEDRKRALAARPKDVG